MDAPKWDQSDVARCSAEIDAELEEVFEELEAVLGKSENPEPAFEDPGSSGQTDDVVLPDDFELPPSAPAEPQSAPADLAPILPDDFELSAAGIAPAADHDPFTGLTPEEIEPLKLELSIDKAPVVPKEDLLPKRNGPLTVAELSPRELAELIEAAVNRGVLAALRRE